eukprot:gene2129-2541_t
MYTHTCTSRVHRNPSPTVRRQLSTDPSTVGPPTPPADQAGVGETLRAASTRYSPSLSQSQSQPLPKFNYILDICLDYFSVNNPFLAELVQVLKRPGIGRPVDIEPNPSYLTGNTSNPNGDFESTDGACLPRNGPCTVLDEANEEGPAMNGDVYGEDRGVKDMVDNILDMLRCPQFRVTRDSGYSGETDESENVSRVNVDMSTDGMTKGGAVDGEGGAMRLEEEDMLEGSRRLHQRTSTPLRTTRMPDLTLRQRRLHRQNFLTLLTHLCTCVDLGCGFHQNNHDENEGGEQPRVETTLSNQRVARYKRRRSEGEEEERGRRGSGGYGSVQDNGRGEDSGAGRENVEEEEAGGVCQEGGGEENCVCACLYRLDKDGSEQLRSLGIDRYARPNPNGTSATTVPLCSVSVSVTEQLFLTLFLYDLHAYQTATSFLRTTLPFLSAEAKCLIAKHNFLCLLPHHISDWDGPLGIRAMVEDMINFLNRSGLPYPVAITIARSAAPSDVSAQNVTAARACRSSTISNSALECDSLANGDMPTRDMGTDVRLHTAATNLDEDYTPQHQVDEIQHLVLSALTNWLVGSDCDASTSNPLPDPSPTSDLREKGQNERDLFLSSVVHSDCIPSYAQGLSKRAGLPADKASRRKLYIHDFSREEDVESAAAESMAKYASSSRINRSYLKLNRSPS